MSKRLDLENNSDSDSGDEDYVPPAGEVSADESFHDSNEDSEDVDDSKEIKNKR